MFVPPPEEQGKKEKNNATRLEGKKECQGVWQMGNAQERFNTTKRGEREM